MLRLARVLVLVLFASLLFFGLVLQSSPSVTSADAASPDILEETCNRTARGSSNVNYGFCVEALRAVPQSSRADLPELALISLRLARANATHAKSRAKALLRTAAARGSSYERSCLGICRELYADAAADLKTASRMVKKERLTDAKVYESSAVDASGGCEDCFQEGGIASPLVEENRLLFELTVIALGITSLLGQ